MDNCTRFIGMDLHKATIAVAIAEGNGGDPTLWREIPNTQSSVNSMVKRLSKTGKTLNFCYEAGPCGYVVYRQLRKLNQSCVVVAPSLIPKKPGERIKTDKRDARSLSRLLRSGDLTNVWVPDKEHEAIRDLCRARFDINKTVRCTKQQLNAYLLRNGKQYTGKRNWTKSYFRWLETVKFDSQTQQIVFQEYIDTVKHIQEHEVSLKDEITKAVDNWSLKPVIVDLMALRGVKLITAITLISELGDLSRFRTPSELMAFIGLVPSEYSTGNKRRQGGITKTGNTNARRILIESAWAYHFPARKTSLIQRRAEKASEEAQKIAWKAQKRLCKRFAHLTKVRRKPHNVVVVSIARELSGFVWAIANNTQNKILNMKGQKKQKNNIA